MSFSILCFFFLLSLICVFVIMALDFQDSGSFPVCTKTQNSGSCEVYLRLRVNFILKFYAWSQVHLDQPIQKWNKTKNSIENLMFILVLEFNLPDFKLSAFWKT
ncbi:hypothetical protein ACQJBY_063568 [Aegilops geniculata]